MFSSAMEVYCLTSWLLARFNKSLFGFRTAGVIMCGLENLLVAMIHTSREKASTCGNNTPMLERHYQSVDSEFENKAPLEAGAPGGATSRVSRILTSILYCELQLLHQRMQ